MLVPKQIDAAIRAIAPGSETTLNDGALGRNMGALKLVIRSNSTGISATWFAAWKKEGQRGKKALGRYPDMSLAQARERMREEITPTLLSGKNPRAVVAPTEKPTVDRLFRAYVAGMRSAGRSSADQVEWELLLGTHAAVKTLGANRLAGDIDPSDIAHVLSLADKRGARSGADHLRSYLSAAFNFGIKATHDYRQENRQDWGIKFNPVAMVKKDTGASVPRDRALSFSEIREFWHGLNGPGFADGTEAILRLLILCGQRVRETLRVEGRDIDLEAKVWRMPAEKTKTGKFPHHIPLEPMALEIFRDLIAYRGNGYLFPLRAGDCDEPTTDRGVSRAVRRYLAREDVKIEHFQTRDLRRTWKSRAGDAGVDRFTRDLIQQHAQTDTGSKHYDRADYLPQMREAMIKWESHLKSVIGV